MAKMKLPELKRIESELEYEKALYLTRKLRFLIDDGQKEFRSYRKKLLKLMSNYENENWVDEDKITDKLIEESDKSAKIIEEHYLFYANRQSTIRSKLKSVGLKQKDLALLLGHSKTHISLLLNGVSQFTTTDIRIIMIFLDLKPHILIPPFISKDTAKNILNERSEVAKTFVSKFQLKCPELQFLLT